MTGRRRKAPKPTEDERPTKKKAGARGGDEKQPGTSGNAGQVGIHEIYRQCVVDGSSTERLDKIKEWEEKGAVADIIWPFLVSNPESKEYFHACHVMLLLIAHQYWEGSFGGDSYVMDIMQEQDTLDKLLETILYKTEAKDLQMQTQVVTFLVVALSSNNKVLHDRVLRHMSGVGLYHWVSDRRRELELKRSAGLRRKFTESEKTPMWIVHNIQTVLDLLEGHSEYGVLVKIKDQPANDAEQLTMGVPLDVWSFLHRSLEFVVDLLSARASRMFFATYLDSIHFSVRCRLAVGHRFAIPENLRLVQHLLGRINGLLSFPIENSTQKHQSKVEVVSMHHARATALQKMAYRHYPDELQPVIYSGVGLLCSGHAKNSYLERSFVGFSDEKLQQLLFKMRLMPDADATTARDFLLQVLGNYLSIPPYPLDQLREFPLYPTESLLWDHSIIPPSSMQLRSSQVLALPKLNAKFLSFQDYMHRNYELLRLESAYEIRSDLVNVVKRVRPLLRQVNSEESEDISLRTEFSGWSRMALEFAQPFRLLEVDPPRLGETFSSRVVAEITVDLERCGNAIREEWDAIGEYDNLFLLALDASKMTGGPAPLLKDFHLHHGAHKMWDSDSQRQIPDDEDSTFPRRFGVTLVRGCMVLQVRNEQGTVLSEPGVQISDEEKKSTKRIFKVALDSAQYAMDSKSPTGTEMYQQFNLVVRRHGKENNFKAVLETLRGLLEGAGSIDRVVPHWLQTLVLGHGDPSSASYKSETMKSYAQNTVGVNKPTDFLDFGDTFLDRDHLRESFDAKVVFGEDEAMEESKGSTARNNFKIRFSNSKDGPGSVAEAVALPFPKGIVGNPVRFTTLQVEAIRSGLSPGLTVVVGPPGTGKTDVAVQIIASLYHTYPTQRTVIITHSNAALNDIFSKVMARGDVDERFMVRLGAGERLLETSSSHDFTKIGRVAFSLNRREQLLEEVQRLSESLGISGKAQRGPDGAPSYTCETAEYFKKHQVQRRRRDFESKLGSAGRSEDQDVSDIFPFAGYFSATKVTLAEARNYFKQMDEIFGELAEYRPFELLRSQRQRADYLITKQARIVAMTCTHAAIARSHLIELGFEYDNIVMEESGQMLEIESFIPCLLQSGKADDSVSGVSRLKRVCMLGDHNQLPPVVKNSSFSKYSNLDQSLMARLIKLGVPYIQLDKQGRARSDLMKLYSWRYNNLSDLKHVSESQEFLRANTGFAHTFQMINVDDFNGDGESTPTPYYYQNLGEAEFVVALFQYMVLIGYDPKRVSIITTYNGQKELISDIVSQRCGPGCPLEGITPKSISTVDQYQGQQNDIILLSLVRTKSVGHLRDIRRLVVAVSRARLGLYVFCRQDLFCKYHELKKTMDILRQRPSKLQLVLGETSPSERMVADEVARDKIFEVQDVSHLGSIVHSMQENMVAQEDET